MGSSQYQVPGEVTEVRTSDVLPELVAEAAERLIAAHFGHETCSPVRDLIGHDDVVAAYLVQQRFNAPRVERGARVVGRKIGATSKAVQTQLGVNEPDFGVLFDDMGFEDGTVIPAERLVQAKAEAEVAFVLREDLADGPLDEAQIRGAIDYAVEHLKSSTPVSGTGTSLLPIRLPTTLLAVFTFWGASGARSRKSIPSRSPW